MEASYVIEQQCEGQNKKGTLKKITWLVHR